MTIKLTSISKTISKAYDIHPKFAEDMNRYLEQYAEYYYKIFERDWVKKKDDDAT
tara:strand:+ start:356 stop:520 length:165 start_codon:yes stop_codon:yes gene_type:complete